jgi:DNA polymerase-3 subunit delta
MKLSQDSLKKHLDNHSTLLPLYLIHGDEPLWVEQSRDAIINNAKKNAFNEVNHYSLSPGFDWESLTTFSSNYSLFSEKKLIVLKLQKGKLEPKGADFVKHFCERKPADTLLILTSGKLDSSSQKTAWFKAIDKVGAHIPIWPIEGKNLPQWIFKECKSRQLSVDFDACQYLAKLTEGNLLAATQEIEKLVLLNHPVTIDAIDTLSSNNAHFTLFHLPEQLLLGNTNKAIAILEILKNQREESVLILWAILRDLRVSLELVQNDSTKAAVFKKHFVWEKKKGAYLSFINRHNYLSIQNLLQLCAKIDRTIKGIQAGNAWRSLKNLILLATNKTEVTLSKES